MPGIQITMDRTLIIILSTAIPGVALIVAAIVTCLWIKRRRARRGSLFSRGITPIGDDEIESWKVGSSNEKQALRCDMRAHHTPSPSAYSTKSPSIIQYQTSTRPSFDWTSPMPPLNNKISMDLPQAPGTAVLARAPNARSGLTDDAVPGDEPFVESGLKRQPSKLSKRQNSASRVSTDQRGRGSRANSMKHSQPSYGQSFELPRHSSDGPRIGHSRIYSSSSVPPVLSSSECAHFSALSPPPPPSRGRKDDIGRAIG